jgi:hypothetical protein
MRVTTLTLLLGIEASNHGFGLKQTFARRWGEGGGGGWLDIRDWVRVMGGLAFMKCKKKM